MRPLLSSSIVFVCACFACIFLSCDGLAQTPVTTWHYDNGRTGANTNETILTPSKINKNTFGKLFTQAVDGMIVGQALYLPNVNIPNLGVHNVVYVATMHDSVYAFDADSNAGANAAPLWQVSFLGAGITTIPINMQRCGKTTGWTEVGVLSTMVIDPVAGVLYVVAKTLENNVMVHRLHALNVATGAEMPHSPVQITASYTAGGNTYTFHDAMQVNRPALMLQNGNVYIAMGSNGCRGSKEMGWVIAYNASTLTYQGAFDTEPGMSGAGFWQKGGGLSSDSIGDIYGETADGPFQDGANFGLSLLRLHQSGSTIKLQDWFTPYNVDYLNSRDFDLNTPLLILPDQPGPNPHLAVGVGKEGTLYVVNRDNMGHFCSTCTTGDSNIVQDLPSEVGFTTGALVYWNDTIYTSAVHNTLRAYTLSNGMIVTPPAVQSQKVVGQHSPVISANGTTSGILWQINGSSLMAYNALTLKQLYSSKQAGGGRDVLTPMPHFANIMVANGKIYVGTKSSLQVFGLFGNNSNTDALAQRTKTGHHAGPGY
jgi:hypothetical protein